MSFFKWLSNLFEYKPEFKVGDCIELVNLEEWERERLKREQTTTHICRVGNHSYLIEHRNKYVLSHYRELDFLIGDRWYKKVQE